MIIKHIECKNFRQYRDLDFEFPTRGLIAIIGDNETGKSTVQEMMNYALFGSDALRTLLENVLSFTAKDKEFYVKLTILMGEDTYKIVRGVKGTSAFAELYKNDDKKPLANSPKKVDDCLKDVLGNMTWKTFQHTYCVKQRELTLLSSMRAAERKSFVLRMLQINVIDDVLKDIRSSINILKDKIEASGIEDNLDDFNNQLQTPSLV